MSSELSRRRLLQFAGGGVAGAALAAAVPGTATAAAPAHSSPEPEPDLRTALDWWPDPRNIWTPIGWKDHLFRFHVFYNGTVIGAPMPPTNITPPVQKYAGMGIQLDMSPWGGWFTSGPMPDLYPGHFYVYREDIGLYGHGEQQWADNSAPVLETNWPQSNGVVLRQSTFAHLKGGGDIVTGTEPIYAWVRLSVAYVNPLDVRTNQPIGFAIRVGRSYYVQEFPYTFQDGVVLTGYPENAPFTEDLQVDSISQGGRKGIRLRQSTGTRLAALADGAVPVFTQPDPNKRLYNLEVRLEPTLGAHVDILIAMLPQSDGEFARELALGYDGALAEADQYWAKKPSTAATISTPEPHIDNAIKRNIQFAEIIAEKTPDTNEYTYLTGSYGYDVLWTTPASMRCHSFLDLLGYHDSVARHLDIFRVHQGETPPPGKAYPSSNPGYYGTPANLRAINWITDHGAVMLSAATHALLTADRTFINTWLDSLVKACDFIKAACANTNHDGIKGLPAPAVVSDSGVETQSTWMMAWLYKGFTTTIRLLKKVGHPRAGEFAELAASFKTIFNQAFDSYNAGQPKWTAPNGKQYPVYSQYIIDTPPAVFVDAFELDTGAMSLVWGGLIDGADPRMSHFVDYFRYGPDMTLWGDGTRKNPLDKPVLLHEISSCEPVYSWNVYQSWGAGNRSRYVEGMYSLLVGGMSPQTYIPFEHRHGMSSALGTEGTAMWLVRNAIVDDNLTDDELHLLRMCPLAWLSVDQDTVFEGMPTLYGPVSLRFGRTSDSDLSLSWMPKWRDKPRKVVVHFPPGIERIAVNGKRHNRPGSGELILAP